MILHLHDEVNTRMVMVQNLQRFNSAMQPNQKEGNGGNVISLPHLYRGDGVHLFPESCGIYMARRIKAIFNDVSGPRKISVALAQTPRVGKSLPAPHTTLLQTDLQLTNCDWPLSQSVRTKVYRQCRYS